MKYFYRNTGSQRPHPEDHTRIVAGGAVVEVSEHYHEICEETTNKVGGNYFVPAPEATEETPAGMGEYDHLTPAPEAPVVQDPPPPPPHTDAPPVVDPPVTEPTPTGEQTDPPPTP